METESGRWARIEDDKRQAREAADVALIRSWADDPELLRELGHRVVGAMTGERPLPVGAEDTAPKLMARNWFATVWLDRARRGVCLECGGRGHFGLTDDEVDPIPCPRCG